MSNTNLNNKFKKITILLREYLPLLSQWDLSVISGDRIDHKWITSLMKLDRRDLVKFDAGREHALLDDPQWHQLISDIENLGKFKKSKANVIKLATFGNVKKQHELKQLYSFLDEDKGKAIVDFGGGVGNLAYFLEEHLSMNVIVLEKDLKLIEKGQAKLSKMGSRVTFNHCHVCNNNVFPDISNCQLAIGLHTCGNFATDMFRVCIKNKINKIINFGCCYSKIKDSDYNLSSGSDKSFVFNQRALSSATQSFHEVPAEFYDYRSKIMKYKFSFHHWLFKKQGHKEFCSMSNARSRLYQNTFSDYFGICLNKFFAEITVPEKSVIDQFYESDANEDLHKYFSAFYALRRYLGKLLELYILCDRALFLEEKGYTVEIVEVFDPNISPRCRAIVATSL